MYTYLSLNSLSVYIANIRSLKITHVLKTQIGESIQG